MVSINSILNAALIFEEIKVRDKFLNNESAYTIGIFISVLLLGYLVYALFKPEKF